MKAWLIQHAFSLIAGPIVGIATYYFHEAIQHFIEKVNESKLLKSALAIVLPVILTPIAAVLGQQLPAACTGTPIQDVTACLTAIGDKGWLGAALGIAFGQLTYLVMHPKDQNPPAGF